MKNKYLRWLTTLLSLAACVWPLKLAYTGLDFTEVMQHLRTLDLFWVSVLVLISLSCHTVRSLRWQMLLQACKQPVAFWKIWMALMSGYFVNQALVRGGELIRCYLLKRSDKVSMGTSLGTVVSERVVDTLCLFLLLTAFFAGLGDISFQFFERHINQPLQEMVANLPFGKLLLLGSVLLILLAWLIWQVRKRNKAAGEEKSLRDRFFGFVEESFLGIASVWKVKSKSLFLFYTLLIWLHYFLMTYLWFFTLPETQNLGLRAALFIWAIGNVDRLVPVRGGGAGAYHYLVIQAFLLLGISAGVAGALALAIHGLQTVIYVIFGSFSLLFYLVFTRPKLSASDENAAEAGTKSSF